MPYSTDRLSTDVASMPKQMLHELCTTVLHVAELMEEEKIIALYPWVNSSLLNSSSHHP